MLNLDHHLGLMLTMSLCGLLPFGLPPHSNQTVGTHFGCQNFAIFPKKMLGEKSLFCFYLDACRSTWNSQIQFWLVLDDFDVIFVPQFNLFIWVHNVFPWKRRRCECRFESNWKYACFSTEETMISKSGVGLFFKDNMFSLQTFLNATTTSC